MSTDELQWCRQVLLELFKRGTGTREGRNLDLAAMNEAATPCQQILQPSLYLPELRKLRFRAQALAVARQLMGPDAAFVGDHAILKPPHVGGVTPWHQDEAFMDPNFIYRGLSIWIALHESTLDNGAMAYIPESHARGVLPHRLYGGARNANSIECCDGFDPGAKTVCPVPAGHAIVHDGRTVHGADGNSTGSERLAYIVQFATPAVRRPGFHEFPWLKDFRSEARQRRKAFLFRGGVLLELFKLLRSDRYSHRHLFSGFIGRRLTDFVRQRSAQIRNLFTR
jgi:ectoine hydroxylase-related dioxygenase (phytanoyl-CoA dioxygenase family)